MIDLKLELQSDGTYDIVIGSDGNFEVDEGLTTTILTSIFTEARANEIEVARPLARSGWMGNINFPTNGRQLGSLVWLTASMRRTTENLNKAIDFFKKALNWMVEDGIAETISVTGSLSTKGADISVEVKPFREEPVTMYTKLWENTING
jgi:phage gp46-like protein